jgi:hypothetical protein
LGVRVGSDPTTSRKIMGCPLCHDFRDRWSLTAPGAYSYQHLIRTGGKTVHTFFPSCGEQGVMRRMVPGPHYKTLPSRLNVLTSKRLFFRSEEKERSSHLPCPLARWWERSAQWMRAPMLRLRGRRPSGRLYAIKGKHYSPYRCAPWLRLVMFRLRVRAGLSPRVLKASSSRAKRLGDPLWPRRWHRNPHPSPT